MGFCERHGLAAQLLEAEQGQLTPQRVTDHVAPGSPHLPADLIQLAPQLAVKTDRDCGLHVLHRTTWPCLGQEVTSLVQ